MARHIVALLFFASMPGCSGASTSPSKTTVALPFQAGRYALTVGGGTDECGDDKVPQAGTLVYVTLTMRPDSNGWTATTDTGSLIVHFEPGATSPTQPAPISLIGTASGFADDEAQPGTGMTAPVTGSRVIFNGVAFSGTTNSPISADVSTGTFNGPVMFTRGGVSSTCPPGVAGWLLSIIR